jgi:Abortive infection alpha
MSDDFSVEAAKQAHLGDLLHKIAEPLAEEIGESLGVWARHYRFRLGLRMLQKTERMLKDAGFAPQAVPPRLFLPILENASVEDDEDVQSRWAALLANAAADTVDVHPSYIEILRQFTPQDAVLLDKLHDACESKRTRKVTPC